MRTSAFTGTLIGTCAVAGTGGWQTWVTKSTTVTSTTGVHDVYLKFTGGSGYLFNVNWWQMQQGNPLQIINAAYLPDSPAMQLIWNSTPPASQTNYTLLKKHYLSDPTWTVVGMGIPSGGITTTNKDNSASGDAAFYRISSP